MARIRGTYPQQRELEGELSCGLAVRVDYTLFFGVIMRRSVRIWLACAALAVVAALLAFAMLAFSLRMRVDSMRAELEVRCGITEEFKDRYPTRTEPNEAALRLEEVSSELGIDFVPRHRRTNSVTSKVAGAMSAFAHDEFGRAPWLKPSEATNEVAGYLREHESTLREILDLRPPKWENESMDLLGLDTQLHALINLQRVLSAWALVEAREGRDEEALRILELSWQVSVSLRGESSLIFRLVGLSFERQVVATLLRLNKLPGTWIGRLATIDHADQVRELALADILRSVDIMRWSIESGSMGFLIDFFEPFILDAGLAVARNTRASYPPPSVCFIYEDASEGANDINTSWWNPFDPELARGLLAPWPPQRTTLRAKRLQTEAELASLWFQRDDYDSEARIPSRSCEDLTFVFSLTDDGRRALHFEGEHSFDELQGFPVITRMEERPFRRPR